MASLGVFSLLGVVVFVLWRGFSVVCGAGVGMISSVVLGLGIVE